MAENLIIHNGAKNEKYKTLLPQIVALIGDERDQTAILGLATAALKETFDFLWVGYYLVQGDFLILGPFQGPVPCIRIPKGKGVCGASWQQMTSIVVDDVETFAGHIACSSLSKSEIVVPLWSKGQLIGVLDVDSKDFATFDEVDVQYLEKLNECLGSLLA